MTDAQTYFPRRPRTGHVSTPGRCLRHYSYALYAQPLSTATDRADATFHLE